MDQRAQWSNYHILEQGDASRDLYLVFDDNEKKSLCEIKFRDPFILQQQDSGRRNIGLGCSQFTVPNTAMNISSYNYTNRLIYGDQEITLRNGYYENVDQISQEINNQLKSQSVKFILDHLGYVTYVGERSLNIPLLLGDDDIPDTVAHKLGFPIPCLQDRCDLTEHNGEALLTIEPNSTATMCGDIFGPLSDCLLTCDEAIFTRETRKVLSVFSLSAHPARSQLHMLLLPKFRALHDMPSLSQLTFRLVDRRNREIAFVSGVPSATIELQCL
uniref:LO5 n=1 Tax=Barramundi adomavirus TaxID=2609870 RepID=A0A6F9EZC5_9VIRU|nr:TPA_asm: LO5 [Barramundi adomavirus]